MKLTKNKKEALKRLSNENGVIGALAIDQRGSLKKMIADNSTKEIGDEGIIHFKKLVSEEITPFATAILLDPEYGLQLQKFGTKKLVYYWLMKKQGMMQLSLVVYQIYYQNGLQNG